MTFLELQNKFPDEIAVIKHFILIRYGGPAGCHHCGSMHVYHRSDYPKNFQCMDCNNTFSVFKGTIFENSSTSLIKWMYAIHLFINGKKGISGLQLKREIGVTYKTAWRMLNQIRKAMGNEDMKGLFENIIEVDETYIGGKPRKENKGKKSKNKKNKDKQIPVIGVLDRVTKKVFAKVATKNDDQQQLSGDQLLSVINQASQNPSMVMTDEFPAYNILTKRGYIHRTINHSEKFSNGDIHTNNIEGFWSTLKRGVYGIYHMVSLKHLQLYVNEFCFRYNNRNNENIFDILLRCSISM